MTKIYCNQFSSPLPKFLPPVVSQVQDQQSSCGALLARYREEERGSGACHMVHVRLSVLKRDGL